jgi:hypothetical protein
MRATAWAIDMQIMDSGDFPNLLVRPRWCQRGTLNERRRATAPLNLRNRYEQCS